MSRPDPKPRAKVIVALSGGVDSSVAALLLKEQGYDVQGLFMSNWEEDETGYCTAAEDFQDARRVCGVLDIPLHRVSFAREYRDRVFDYFLTEYRNGRTPNPDVLCNREIKFGACFDYALRLGADLFATGHYARIARDGDELRLCKARDASKDQSYFMHGIDAAVLSRTLFPLAEIPKTEVRRRARAAAVPVFDKKDSTGICFIGERPFREFLQNYLPARPGAIESIDGVWLGEHQGLMYYTLGQRHGIGIGGRAHGPESAWYVGAKDLARNVLIVVQGHDHPALLSNYLLTERVHWLTAPRARFRCAVKTRYRQADQPCEVEVVGEHARVRFESAQRAVTPGQFAVFYDGEACLGGAVIASTDARVFATGGPLAQAG
jgi:tRNA-specific 2-thiouridylase